MQTIQSTDIPNFQYIFCDFTQKRSAHKLKHQRNSIAAVSKRAAKVLGQRGSLFNIQHQMYQCCRRYIMNALDEIS